MKTAGKIILRAMGEYSETATYDILDLVTLDNKLYISKKADLKGVTPTPTDTTNWLLLIDGSADLSDYQAVINAQFEATTQLIDQNKTAANEKFTTIESYMTSNTATVNKAKQDIVAAQNTATSAVQDAATAQARADKGVADAATAQTTANTAKSTADTAKTNAATNASNLSKHITDMNAKLADLQGQVDGSITTHFYNYVPSNTNVPASGWTTNDLKNVHLGDLFYNTTNGYCYRWQIQNGVYSWVRIPDSDATKAMSDAASALSKATAAETKVNQLEAKINSLTFTVNMETGNLDWGMS